VQKSLKSLKWIAGWLFLFSIAAFLFMFVLGLIIHADWLRDNSWFPVLPESSRPGG
jgi:glucan phosphoethanolaminetransferase (alkaline phosphatase superfamily)